MTSPNTREMSPEVMQLFLAEVEVMRDALVQLFLALNDYQFSVESTHLRDIAVEAEEAFAKIMTAMKRSG